MQRPLYLLLSTCFGVAALAQAPPAADRAAADAAFRERDWQTAANAYAAVAVVDPDIEACYRLGYCLHALGQLDEALRWHRRAAALHATDAHLGAIATYNIACVHALQGRSEEALAALRLAVERGFRRPLQLRRDPDLAALRAAPEFPAIVAACEDRAKLVAIVVHDGVETLDFSGPVEVFTSARDEHGDPVYRVRFVAPARRPVTPQHWRATLSPDFGIADCPQPAVLVIPGGDTGVLDEDPAFVAWVQRTAPACEHVLSVCTGAYVLAKAGLLDGVEATTHHGARAVLQRQYPAVRVVDRKVVDNGRIVTAAGVSSGIDGALAVVQREVGPAAAQRIADYMEYAWQPASPPAAAAADPDTVRADAEAASELLYRAAVAAAGGPRPAALAAIERALAAGACPTRTLTERAFFPLHTEPRFRAAIERHARQSEIVMVLDDEPGTPLVVDGVVRDRGGDPLPGALVYVWHTDADGTYTGNSMDEANPRLFGYLRADAAGRYRFRTVRPAAYGRRTGAIEEHIHLRITGPDGRTAMERIGFADDPFWRGREVPPWAVAVRTDVDGRQYCSKDLILRERR